MMHFRETSAGDQLTITITVALPGADHSATLSGPVRGPMIDGLLWWALGRILDHFVAAAYPAQFAAQFAAHDALTTGESIVHYIYTTPFYEADDARASRITELVHTRLPELAPLRALVPQGTELHEQAMRVATIMRERMRVDVPILHGVADMYQQQQTAA